MNTVAIAPVGRQLVLVRSSLQFILALALAEQRRTEGAGASRIVFLPDLLEPGLFERAVQMLADPPFDRVVFVAPRRPPGATRKSRGWRDVQRDLAAALADAQPVEVTVFNDREDAGQALLIETSRRFPQALRCCVEDGAHAYRDFRYRRLGLATRLRQRWRLGSDWHDVAVLGTHPLVQRYSAIHPRLLREELRNDRVLPFPSAQLGSAVLQRFARAFCELAGFDPTCLPEEPLLLSISSSTYAARNPDYAAMMRSAATHLRNAGRPFLYKYHPREPQPDYLGLAATPGAYEIPRAIPLECIYVLARERPLLALGGMSTSLMMAVLLMPRARAAALAHATPVGDRWSANLFEALRISPVATPDALAALLRADSAG